MKRKIVLIIAGILLWLCVPCKSAYAASPTDEILNFTITVDVNDDATLNLKYHLDWKVLESDGIGPMSWVKIGIPNIYFTEYEALSDNIREISHDGNSYMRIDLDRDYYEGEVASFDFLVVQDYMYEMNILTEGETVFYFRPGWFDEIDVDELVISWNDEKAIGWSHGCVNEDGRLVWRGSVSAGETFDEVSVTYPSDAFAFNSSKVYIDETPDYNGGYDYGGNNEYYVDDDNDVAGSLIGFAFTVGILTLFTKVVAKSKSYSNGSGFGSTTTKKKITRTLIKYYPTCPGCGAAKPENSDKCEYCGRSFIESEEVVEEKELTEPSKYENEGTYKYGGNSNTYIRVHVTHVPVPAPRTTSTRSSCAHSSCACAHSCACACACACAGGGRAGCSTKDFYNTSLKLSQLKKKKRDGKNNETNYSDSLL